jgi:hypothetical protein
MSADLARIRQGYYDARVSVCRGSGVPGGLVMAIVEIKIDAVETFAKGADFGEAGSYLRIKGIAKGELDPTAPENSVIADLKKQ